MKSAVIVLGHGSRQEGSDAPLAELAAGLRSSDGHMLVEPAFLQDTSPTLLEAAAKCVDAGAEHVLIVPFFLQPGAHVNRGIPEEIAAQGRRYPAVRFSVTGHVGGHPLMAQIVEDLAGNAKA